MNDAPIKTLWDNDSAMREIDSLRQQLTEAHTCITEKTSYIDWLNGHCSDGWDKADELSGQLADSQKREVLLRDALDGARMVLADEGIWSTVTICEKALAATADLDGLILCHAVEVGWIGTGPRDGRCEFSKSKPANSVMRDFNMKPLYRAWEPK